MARPRKNGLDYFPFDCDFFSDERIIVLAGEFGIKGEIVAVKLLCAIYHSGYFALWDEPLKFKLTHLCQGTTPDLVDQIVNRLVKWGFFDKGLFDSAKVLTSVEIQETYFLACRKRTSGEELPYLLISHPNAQKRQSKQEESVSAPPENTAPDVSLREAKNGVSGVSGAETRVSAEKTPVSGGKTPQIKEKENKENQIRKNSQERVKKNAASGVCLPRSLEEVEEFFQSKGFNSSAELFFNYYQSRGWCIKGSCITDWEALAFAWDKREKNDSPHSSGKTSVDSVLRDFKKTEERRAKEEAAAKAREAKENPDGLTPAQSLALWRQRNGVSSEKSMADCLPESTAKQHHSIEK